MTSVRRKLLILTFLLTMAVSPVATSPTAAQSRAGIRAGISAEPDQFYIGGHVELAEVVKQLWFRPNLEVGAGGGVTLIALNGEFAYFLPSRQQRCGAAPRRNASGVRWNRGRPQESTAETVTRRTFEIVSPRKKLRVRPIIPRLAERFRGANRRFDRAEGPRESRWLKWSP